MPGVRVADHRDVRDDAALGARPKFVAIAVGHDALLVPGLGEQPAGAAARRRRGSRREAPGSTRRRSACSCAVPHRSRTVVVARADAEAGAADGGDPRVDAGKSAVAGADGVDLVAAVTGGEVDADALERGLDERVSW